MRDLGDLFVCATDFNHRMQEAQFIDLPDEMVLEILSHASEEDVLSLSMVSKQFRTLISGDRVFWDERLSKDWAPSVPDSHRHVLDIESSLDSFREHLNRRAQYRRWIRSIYASPLNPYSVALTIVRLLCHFELFFPPEFVPFMSDALSSIRSTVRCGLSVLLYLPMLSVVLWTGHVNQFAVLSLCFCWHYLADAFGLAAGFHAPPLLVSFFVGLYLGADLRAALFSVFLLNGALGIILAVAHHANRLGMRTSRSLTIGVALIAGVSLGMGGWQFVLQALIIALDILLTQGTSSIRIRGLDMVRDFLAVQGKR